MTGAPEGSPKVGLCGFYGFMEKPGIEPATPGLQGIALIHYTTGFYADYFEILQVPLSLSLFLYNPQINILSLRHLMLSIFIYL